MAKKLKYIGPNYNKGLLVDGITYKPAGWKDAEIRKNLRLQPKLKKYFEEVVSETK